MIRVDIETIIMASGPMPSVVVLRERKSGTSSESALRALSIQTGAYEAASIGHGVDAAKQTRRPIAHDLFINTVKKLGSKVERVEINRWEAPVFFADVVLAATDENAEEIKVDARPSDALAIATRSNAPIYVEDDVMNRAGSVSIPTTEQADAEEFEKFDEFVHTLSPDDF